MALIDLLNKHERGLTIIFPKSQHELRPPFIAEMEYEFDSTLSPARLDPSAYKVERDTSRPGQTWWIIYCHREEIGQVGLDHGTKLEPCVRIIPRATAMRRGICAALRKYDTDDSAHLTIKDLPIEEYVRHKKFLIVYARLLNALKERLQRIMPDLANTMWEHLQRTMPELTGNGASDREAAAPSSDSQAIKAERRESLQQQLALQRANLNELELQRARFGIRVPLDLINEIKLVQQRIEEVEQELARLGSGERSPRVAAEEPGRGERTENVRIDSGGGAVIFGDVHVGRDFVGRDGDILSDVHDDEDNGSE